MTQQDKEQLKLEIDHIFESGANEIRIFEMVVNFIDSRNGVNKNFVLGAVSGSTDLKEQCPEFPYFGGHYPDARCINGQLYDLDRCDESGSLYEMHEYHPCPFCNTEEFLKEQEDNEADMGKVRQWMEYLRKRYG